MTRYLLLPALLVSTALASGCSPEAASQTRPPSKPAAAPASTPAPAPAPATGTAQQGHAAAPAPSGAGGLYAFTTNLSPAVANAAQRVYVPNLKSDSVSVIDPATHTVIKTMKVGKGPQHVVPSFDLKRLWATNNVGNSLTLIDPTTTEPGKEEIGRAHV